MAFDFFSSNLEFFAFVLVLSVFLYFKRKNIEVTGSFPFLYMIMYKTKLGLDKMDKWSKSHPNVFLYLAYLSIFIGIIGTIAMFFFMFWQLGYIVENDITAGGGFVLPIKTENGMDSAVPVFYVPFWYWLIALFVLVIVHEFAHGVIAERFGVKIKSSGFAFLGILAPIVPAAFVEPDEKDLKTKKRWQQIAVFGAGSTSNFIFGGLFLLVLIFICAPFVSMTMQTSEISFSNVMNESSLYNYNVTNGTIIAFNGVYDLDNVSTSLMNLSLNQSVNLTINSSGVLNTYEIVTFENPQMEGKGMIGISGLKIESENKDGFQLLGDFPLNFQILIFYIVFLNIGIGMMNLLPIWITDGGQIARSLLEKYLGEKHGWTIFNIISFISLIMIIFTIKPSLLFSLIAMF